MGSMLPLTNAYAIFSFFIKMIQLLLNHSKKVIRQFANFISFVYFCSQNKGMIVTFNEDYLEKLYTEGDTGIKKYRFQPQIVRGYQKAVKYLIQAKRMEDLFPFKSLHFESLHGDKEGRFSIKANDQYRVEFTMTETEDEPQITICNIMELSNHYK